MGILGYCLKDFCEFHFQNNVIAKGKNISKLVDAKHGVVVFKNHVLLSQNIVIKFAYPWAKYKMPKHLGSCVNHVYFFQIHFRLFHYVQVPWTIGYSNLLSGDTSSVGC